MRAALIVLAREGLLDFSPNRGYFLSVFTAKDVHEIFSLRTALENLAAELTISRMDDGIYTQHEAIQRRDTENVPRIDMRFHQVLIEASGHDLLMKSWKSIVAEIAALLLIRAEAFPRI